MEKFDAMYDKLSEIYSELESIMAGIYQGLEVEPENIEKAELLQGLGSIALKVISSQEQLVEDYGSKEFKDTLLSNLDDKRVTLSNALAHDRHSLR